MKTFIVIPAFNEERNITRVLQNLIDAGFKNLIVVDDKSTDNTLKLLSDFQNDNPSIIVYSHTINQGQGAALRHGTKKALSEGADIIVHFDSDGQHRIEDLQPMIKPIKNGEVDITMGSRFMDKKSKIPIKRLIMLKTAILLLRVFYGLKLTDAHNGFRVLSRKAAQTIRINSNRMEHASEIIQEIATHKLRYKEVPIIVNYSAETIANGTASVSTAFKILYQMIRMKIREPKNI